MRFIVEPLNNTDCRIIDIDCSELKGMAVDEVVIPSTVEEDGKTYYVKEVGKPISYETILNGWGRQENVVRIPEGCCFANSSTDIDKMASLRRLKKIVISEGIERLNVVMGNRGTNANERGNADFLTEVVLPSTLKAIGPYAFSNCKKLTTINIPPSVEEIGEKAFSSCLALPLFQWPVSLKKVNISAFDSMRSPDGGFVLNIPDSIKEITGGAYGIEITNCIVSSKAWPILDASNLCETIKNIDIPEGARKISNPKRHKFTSAKHVGIPSTIEEIDAEVFYHDTEVSADESTLHRVMGMPGVLNGTLVETIDIPEGATEVWVENCPNLKTLSIPDSVTTIKGIKNCPKLEELSLPNSVEVMVHNPYCSNDNNFYGINARITASPKVWNLICSRGGLVDYHPKNTILTIPEGVTGMKAWFRNCGITSVILPSSIKYISGGFSDCESLETITFPSSPVKYNGSPVLRCKNLKYVIFPADDPATATYPTVLGKRVDWYVPDNMSAHVKELIKDKKVDAKSVKSISKLPGYEPAASLAEEKKPTVTKKKATTKKPTYLKPIKLTNNKLSYRIAYVFAVPEEDKHLLDHSIDAAALAVHYMRTKANECMLKIEQPYSDIQLNAYEDNNMLVSWQSYTMTSYGKSKPKATVKLDFKNPAALPEGFPSEAVEYPDFSTFWASRLPAIGRKLPKVSEAFLEIKVDVRANYEFMIDLKESFSDKKLHLLEDNETGQRIPLGVAYGKRYIPATSIDIEPDGTELHIRSEGYSKGNSDIIPVKVWGVRIKTKDLPLIDKILNALR